MTKMDSENFDYVVVGAGTAGCVLAKRLSDHGATVCLLEAGPKDTHPFIHIPAGYIKNLYSKTLTWGFRSEGSVHTNNRSFSLPQGRVLGGSSSINGLNYVRGQREDYDFWAGQGNAGWTYEEILPYFMRSERKLGPGDERFRGRSGELPISELDWHHPVCDDFLSGLEKLGIPRTPDYNGATHAGSGFFQRTIEGGFRHSSAKAFLRPALRSGKVDVRTEAQASRILFEGKRAVGVELIRGGPGGRVETVRARREVILSAGALNSPKLLQMSGVGPAEVLQRIGVPVLHALQGVGNNLRDHYAVRMVSRLKGVSTINNMVQGPALLLEIARWLLRKPTPLAVSPSLVHVFWKSRPSVPRPDLEYVFSPASFREGVVGLLDKFPGMTLGLWQGRPESLGYAHAKSSNPFVAPEIQPNYLSHEVDRQILLDGMKQGRKWLANPDVQPYLVGETSPGPGCVSDDEWLDFAREKGTTVYHMIGTCRMGPADRTDSVVDSELRVHGLQGLRVIDASIMPTMPSVNTNASTLMIAEKGADMVLGRTPLPAARDLPSPAFA